MSLNSARDDPGWSSSSSGPAVSQAPSATPISPRRVVQAFEYDDFDEQINVLRQLTELRAAFIKRVRVELNSEFFSRVLLEYLWLNGAFVPSPYDKNQPMRDYEFMRDLFNKSSRGYVSEREGKKSVALILGPIKNFVMAQDVAVVTGMRR